MKIFWDFVDKWAGDVLKSGEFPTMERSLLQKLVKRDTLNTKEVALFRAVNCWAEKECEKKKLKADGPAKRVILGEQIIKNSRFPVMKKSEFMNVVLKTNMLTQEETGNIIKFHGTTVDTVLMPLGGFLENERVGTPLRCCRFNIFAGQTIYCEDNYDVLQLVTLTVDRDIVLHGVSVFVDYDTWATYRATVNVYNGALCNDDSVLTSQTGLFDLVNQDSVNASYRDFDVLFDNVVVLRKNVQYCIAAAINESEVTFYSGYGKDVQRIHCGGVTFNFGDEPTIIAEFLFKVDD